MKSLDQIGFECSTDKSRSGHFYTRYYEMFFSALRDKEISILEIGVLHGQSLRMWKEYFQKAKISGLDIDDYSHIAEERIEILRGDQSSVEDLKQFEDKKYDIILDDGAHFCKHQLISFHELFKCLNPGGFYVIEDLLCAYHEQWNREGDTMARIKQMIDEVNLNGKIPISALNANKQEQVEKYDCTYYEKNIEWVFNSMGLVIIKKM